MNRPVHSAIVGAAPEGAGDPQAAARAVREMFTSIAPRYDLLNHLLSFNVDRMWWRKTARRFAAVLSRPDANVLDLCCGTGDMTFALLRQAGKSGGRILGTDFSHAMLQRASAKSVGKAPRWVEADALR
ncbi:MAG: class I SAM-dependent methyltransferase, partial [Terriglobales bacterium]